MYINLIELNGYRRLSLNNINKLRYEPTTSETIVGGNGSGKTSLVEQLTPILSDKKDFPDGSKLFEATHRGSEYKLTYSENRFSFIKDGDELNNGKTMKVQNRLIQEYFGLTPLINDVFLNKKNFVTMSVAERKEWLTVISPTDYEYVLGVFKKAKDKQRDKQGAMRQANTRLMQIEKNLLQEKDYNELTGYIDALRYEINKLTKAQQNVDVVNDPLKAISSAIGKIKILREKRLPFVNSEYFKALITITDVDIKKKSLLLEQMDGKNLTSTKELEVKLTNINNHADNINVLSLEYSTVNSIRNFLLTNEEELRTILSNHFDTYTEFTTDGLDMLNKNIIISTSKYDALFSEIKRNESKLSLLLSNKENDSVECPKCSYEFKHGYTEKDEDKLVSDLSMLRGQIDPLSNSLNDMKERLSEISNFITVRNNLNSILNTNADIRAITINDAYGMTNKLIAHIGAITELHEDILNIQIVESDLNIAKMIDDELKIKMNKEKDDIMYSLDSLRRLKTLTHKNLNFSINQENMETELSELITGLDKLYVDKDEFVKMKYTELINDYYDEIINTLNVELAEKEKILRLHNNDLVIYGAVKGDVEVMNKDVLLLADIIKALSPNKGLIAKSIIGFLNVFIGHVNEIINTIWSYDMKVLVPEITDSDLDYKFPVMVEGDRRDDISQTSTGMKAIINLAFKLSSMSFLNMKDFPIYLDEFGSSFDTEHRRKAIELIKKIKDDFPQLFLISHYDDVLYALDNNIVSLSNDNLEIVKNKKYNQNMTLS